MHDDLDRAFGKLERALPAGCRRFLDRLPLVVKAKGSGRKNRDDRRVQDLVSRAVDASLQQRRISMRYASFSSGRTKEYVLEPLRLAYAFGGIYLQAFVPEYGEVRTFAMERASALGIMDERFEPRPLPVDPFPDSLGVHSGKPERIEIEFDASAAPFVREREWHRSQQIDDRADGAIVVRLDVCVDTPLKQWILGFGPAARVLSPATLAAEMLMTAEAMRARYVTGRKMLAMEMALESSAEIRHGATRQPLRRSR
jgi:predicted DNA-binding transcriptional regulator YafY